MADDLDLGGIYIGTAADGTRQLINLKRANRHGLIAGATGTGKTVTLQGIVEGFRRLRDSAPSVTDDEIRAIRDELRS